LCQILIIEKALLRRWIFRDYSMDKKVKNQPEVELAELVIRPSKGWVSLNLMDLWRYRELVFFLTWRDISVRYKQTALGAAWAVLQPFLTMVVFSVFFGALVKVPSDGLPYPVWNFCALIPWQLFAYSLAESGNSLVANQNLITKVYFPRVIIPIAATLGGLLDFAIAFVVLIGMMLFYHLSPTSAIWTLPLFILLAIITALGAGLWLSALNVEYRDVRYTITFLIQFWMFMTPIAYPSSIVPEQFRVLYGLNPMTGVVEGFRWALLGSGQAPGLMTGVSAVIAVALFFSGLAYFRRMERSFADKV
jgi:lipopolysaccharide transport system permease protein